MDKDQNLSGNWIPIVDYAALRGVSTSTLRRYIKAQKIKYKIEHGRYLLLDDGLAHRRWDEAATRSGVSVYEKVNVLEAQLMAAREEINELKMLVALYEEKL